MTEAPLEGPKWLDALAFLERLQNAIPPGQLFCTPHFNLYDAMSAVEVGDPKLDICASRLPEPSSDHPREFNESVSESWSPSETIAIMDKLLRLEATWHRGHALLQTVYTCIPVLQPDRCTTNEILSAYCSAVRATCRLVHNLVCRGEVCKEEDFVLHNGNVPLCQPSDDNPLGTLSGAEDRCASWAAPQEGRPDAGGQSACPPGWKLDKATSSALHCRLRFRKAFLQGLNTLQGQREGRLDAMRKHFLTARSELQQIQKTAVLSGDVKPPGFDPGITRYFLANAPPRVVEELSAEETWKEWDTLLQELLEVCDVAKIGTYRELKARVEAFSEKDAGAIVRSAWAVVATGKTLTLPSHLGRAPAPWLPCLAMVCAELGLPPPDAAQGPGPSARFFTQQVEIGLLGYMEAMCMNKARQRRRLRTHIEDWAHLFQHALQADGSQDFQAWLQTSPISWQPLSPDDPVGCLATWTEKEAAHVLLRQLLLGFELDVYAQHEYCYLYWYCEYLHGVVSRNASLLMRMHARVKPQANGASPASTKASASKKRSGGRSKEPKQAPVDAGPSPPSPTSKSSEEQRYEQRFVAFQRLMRPDFLPYDEYRNFAGLHHTQAQPGDLLCAAHRKLVSARNDISSLLMNAALLPPAKERCEVQVEALKAMDRVCAQNRVAVAVMDKLVQGPAPSTTTTSPVNAPSPPPGLPLVASFDFSHHPHYPVLQLKHRPVTGAAASHSS